MKITIYSTSSSSYSELLRNYLQSKDVEFNEKYIDQDEVLRDELKLLTKGFLGVPVTIIEKDGVTETVIGFDKGKVDRLIDYHS